MATTNDNKLLAMNEAQKLYHRSKYMSRQERYDAVVSLAQWNLFSVAQLSQLSGISVSTIYGFGIKGHGSGKFNPMSLDTLIQIRLNRNNNIPVSTLLIKAAVEEGNSHRVIAKLTGLAPTTITRKINEQDSSTDLQRAADYS